MFAKKSVRGAYTHGERKASMRYKFFLWTFPEKAQLTYIESFWPRRKLPLKRRKQDLNLLIYKDRKTPKR